MNRAALVVLGAIATVATAAANLYAALYVGSNRCGGEGYPEPAPGPARGEYCDFFEHPDDRITLLTGLLVYAPVLIVLGAVIWSVVKGDGRVLAGAVLIASVWPAAYVLPALLLTAS